MYNFRRMKKILSILLLSFIFISCKKETTAGIAGSWTEDAYYGPNERGELSWGPGCRWPMNYTFTTDGKYSSFQEMSGGEGRYSYNPSTRKLQFESTGSGSIIVAVSLLDDNYLVLDNPFLVNEKTRFKRN